MHIINSNKVYMTLCKTVADSIDVTKLQDCETFIGTQQYYNRVMELHNIESIDEAVGSDLMVWDDGLVESYHIECYLDVKNIEEGISNLHPRHFQ